MDAIQGVVGICGAPEDLLTPGCEEFLGPRILLGLPRPLTPKPRGDVAITPITPIAPTNTRISTVEIRITFHI